MVEKEVKNDLNNDKHQLLLRCKALLTDAEKAIHKVLSRLEPNSLEHLASSQVSDPKKNHFIALIHPTKANAKIKVDCMLLRENYIAIFDEQDRELVKKLDRILKIHHCLETAHRDLHNLVTELQALIHCETSKKEILYDHSKKAHTAKSYKPPESHFISLAEKFITKVSLHNLKSSNPRRS